MAARIKVTPVYHKLDIAWRSGKYRVIALQGGTRSSKTYSILQRICIACLETDKPLRIAICAKRFTWVFRNVFPQFKQILEHDLDCWNEKRWNGSRYTYYLNGSEILFLGFEGETGKSQAHGLETDICFINEANFVEQSIYRQLLQRNKQLMIIDFNPNFSKNHWIIQTVLPHPECYFMRSTYKDNPFLPETLIKTIEGYEPTPGNIKLGTADEQLWKIYGLGEMAIIKGLIFTRYKEVEDNEFPKLEDFDKYGYGLDFGFSNDPTALILAGIKDNDLYLKELLYELDLTSIVNPNAPEQGSIEQRLKELEINKHDIIVADSSRPEMIKDLKNCGYNIIPCKKGHGSVVEGINCIKLFRLRIHADSYNLLMELNNYKWKEKRDETQIAEPIDKFNHGIDATRYIVFTYLRPKMNNTAQYDMKLKIKTGIEKYDAF